MDFNTLRNTYKKFIYNDYKVYEDCEKIYLEYDFEIENLSKFNPRIEILKKDFNFKNVDTDIVKNIVFNIGMIEAISYYKLVCCPQFIIKCGFLDENQKKWFEKLYYLGLGEFRFVNNVKIERENFVEFIPEGNIIKIDKEDNNLDGIIVPIGGGKDSNVTLDLLKDYKNKTLCFYIGNKSTPIECAAIAGFNRNEIIEVKRNIDNNLLELNKQGLLNGHTPFSAIVAFLTYLTAYLLDKKYIVLSNEDSANETNIEGNNITSRYNTHMNDTHSLSEWRSYKSSVF